MKWLKEFDLCNTICQWFWLNAVHHIKMLQIVWMYGLRCGEKSAETNRNTYTIIAFYPFQSMNTIYKTKFDFLLIACTKQQQQNYTAITPQTAKRKNQLFVNADARTILLDWCFFSFLLFLSALAIWIEVYVTHRLKSHNVLCSGTKKMYDREVSELSIHYSTL